MPPKLRSIAGANGSSLVEVLVAASLLITALASIAQVFAIATNTRRLAHDATRATVLAQQKMEELVAAAAMPAGLSSSPPGALTANTAGWFDIVDARVRRWSVEPLASDPAMAVVIRVIVTASVAQGRAFADLTTVRRRLVS